MKGGARWHIRSIHHWTPLIRVRQQRNYILKRTTSGIMKELSGQQKGMEKLRKQSQASFLAPWEQKGMLKIPSENRWP